MKNNYITTFMFLHPGYFFSNSQLIDYQLGKSSGLTFSSALDLLQTQSPPLDAILTIFSHLFQHNNQKTPLLTPNQSSVEQHIQDETLPISINALYNLTRKKNNQQSKKIPNQLNDFSYEMKLKGLFNIVYVILHHIYLSSEISLRQHTVCYLKEVDMDDLLMKFIGLSLQVHYIPIKKLSMLYTIVLALLFEDQSKTPSTIIYSDQNVRNIAIQNLLRQDYMNLPQVSQKRQNQIEQYYKKHNMNECPLAQYIVVGMLRSLLTICNSHTHKKFVTTVGAGVDAFREWQVSYNYVLQKHQQLQNRLSQGLLTKVEAYRKFNQSFQLNNGSDSDPLFNEFYQHKIYTTSAITSLFMLLLISLKKNLFIQYSYLLQLISDANGILVFLKFLTDKFQNLQALGFSQRIFGRTKLTFKDEVALTVYNVLSMLYGSCNNYPQKIRNFLFQYNSYLIVKKIPRIFFASAQVLKNQEEQMLPSRQDLQNPPQGILTQLTELCYDLLRIQIPFFSKKMKENVNNMKMIVEIYCRFPKKVQPIVRSEFDKILIKNKVKPPLMKYITSVEDLKNIHNEFNNQQYWENDFIINKVIQSEPLSKQLPKDNNNQIDVHIWLEQNIWRYYD